MEVLLAGLDLELSTDASLDSRGQRAGLVLLGCVLLSFAFIRFSTRMIRAEVSWWPGNVAPGGLHIHHLVFGIVTMMLAGFLGFAFDPDSPWWEILAGLFGIGVGLTLDEFALWLYLEDVYWSDEGRRSVDAVIFAVVVGGFLVLGFLPISQDDTVPAIAATIAVVLAICLVVAVKGKLWSAIFGMFVPLLGIIAAIRLAQPESPWARRRYKAGSRKLEKAEERQRRHDRRWRWLQDAIGGTPSKPSPRSDSKPSG